MARKNKSDILNLNIPLITKDGHLDLTKFPIDATLRQAVGNDMEKIRSACNLLGSMAYAGRTEAGVFLCGLLTFCGEDRTKKELVVKALGEVRTRQSANALFEELNGTESSNSTRVYINVILEALENFPLELVEDGFRALLSDSKWSYRMKRKFGAILGEVEYRNRKIISKL